MLYFGTSTGRVYKLVDSGGGTLTAAANWSPYVTNSQLDSVTSSVISDQNYIYFGGYDVQGAGNAYGFYRIPCVNPSPFPAPTLTLTPVSSSPSWVDTINGRMVWTAGSNRIYRVSTVSWGVDASYAPGTTFTAPTSIPIDTIYEGGQNGVMYGLVPYGDPNTVTPATGFPFNPSSGSAISGGAGWDSLKSRLIFGNDLGQIYTLNVTLGGAWNLGTTYWRSTTTGGAIQTTPLVQDGVMYVSNTTGKVYVFDFYNGYVGPPYGENLNQTLLVTWNFGSGALGDLSREAVLTGRLYVGTTGGKLYAFWPTPDPTVAK